MTPSPQQLPPKFTASSSGYAIKATLAVVSVALFFVLFFALVAGSFYALYWAVMYPMFVVNRLTIPLKLVAIAGAGMLVAFMLKFLFKLRNHVPENRVEITEEDEPELWRFILAICEETGAPKPKYIYVDPDVNAYVRYTNNLLSLIMPVRKELTIGMPLMFALNTSEFKAVMSHEFGHFAQRSMKIGTYIGTSNTIIHDMIFNHDGWDRVMLRWRRSDFRIAVFGWMLWGVVYVLRLMMRGFYFLLNVLHSSLSREMEFNADKFAVSTTGSVPIISALWKLNPLSDEWNRCLKNGFAAKQKKIYSSNLFQYLETEWSKKSEALHTAEMELEQDPKGGKRYFMTSVISKSHMYDSHPPNDEREASAKTPFIACEVDDSLSMHLLGKSEKWQQRLTKVIYREYWGMSLPNEVEEQAFVDFIKEEAEVGELLESYDNTFAQRYLYVPAMLELKERAVNDGDKFPEDFAALRAALIPLMDEVKAVEQQMELAQHIYQGTARVSSLTIDGKTYTKRDISAAYDVLNKKRNAQFESRFMEWDKQLCVLLACRANATGKMTHFLDILEQHERIVNALKAVVGLKNTCFAELNKLQQMKEVDETDISRFRRQINDVWKFANEELDRLATGNFVALPTIESSEEMMQLIVHNGQLRAMDSSPFENGGFDTFVNQLDKALFQLNRMEQSSLSVLLKFEKAIG